MRIVSWLSVVLIVPLVTPQVGRYQGRPVFGEGTDLGYYIWHDEDGWQVRWTTQGAMRHFTGRVTAEGGDLKSLKRIDVEEERKVVYAGRPTRVVTGPRGRTRVVPGRAPVVVSREQDRIEKEDDQTIVFSARTDNDIDGFRFRVDEDVRVLRFALQIDGSPRPQLLEVGRDNWKPGELPLIVRLR